MEKKLIFLETISVCPTVLGNKGNATVYDDGNVISAELLVFKGVSFSSRSFLDVCVPQREICPAHALKVQCPEHKISQLSVTH